MKFLLHVKEAMNEPVQQLLKSLAILEPYNTKQPISSYDLVVLDAMTCTTGDKLYKDSLDNMVPLLVLNPGDEQKKLIAEKIGFKSPGASIAYLVKPVKDNNGRIHYRILEQPFSSKGKCGKRSAVGEGPGMKEQSDLVMRDVAQGSGDKYPSPLELKSFGAKAQELLKSDKTVATDVPPDMIWAEWDYSVPQTFTATGDKDDDLGTPTPQDLSCYTTYEFKAYLNNWPETGPFQYLFMRQSGIYQTNGMKHDGHHEKGWYLTQVATNYQAPPELFYYQSSPANTNDSKEVTTTSGFEVNFDQDGAGASYKFSESETDEIYDWKVIQKTANSWQYSQEDPYSGTTDDFPDNMVEKHDKGELKSLPDISKYALQYDIQLVWKTNSVLRKLVEINCEQILRADYIKTEHETGTKWIGCWWYYWDPIYPSFSIDLSKVSQV